ncbi:OmpA/MotB family protein [Blastopirellula marina]|uniref:Probable outer membrane protein A (OmpA) n=1 Tax=Blastopirellula marina DSM 3645 TaxID=314230 RepID=A4A191_9BACT|nr:OmpA family protein [Blastopirellula marina]EAQ77443.1 probable outer membrane protein A (OmpA) [Blastopirellula marina DSM 3645]
MFRFVASILLIAFAAGCTGDAALRQQALTAQQQQQAQIAEFQRRASGLDANNQDLHAQIAQTQQQSKILQDEVGLLKKQLRDAGEQLTQAQQQIASAKQENTTLLASTRQRGGATITPNNSLQQSVSQIQISGAQVRVDGDLIRIEIPADQIFMTGTNTLHQNAYGTLDQVANAIRQQFPRNLIGVEGHTDNQAASPPFASQHQLSASMAQATFDQLVARGQVPPNRLFVVGHGGNHPVVSNATPAGQARNRRIDIVIYPEDVGS